MIHKSSHLYQMSLVSFTGRPTEKVKQKHVNLVFLHERHVKVI